MISPTKLRSGRLITCATPDHSPKPRPKMQSTPRPISISMEDSTLLQDTSQLIENYNQLSFENDRLKLQFSLIEEEANSTVKSLSEELMCVKEQCERNVQVVRIENLKLRNEIQSHTTVLHEETQRLLFIIQEKERLIDRLKEDKNLLKEELEATHTHIEHSNIENDKQNSLRENKIKSLMDLISKLNSQVNELKTENESLKYQLDQMSRSNERNVSNFTKQIDSLTMLRKESELVCKDLKSENENLSLKITFLDRERLEFESVMTSLKNEICNLKNQLKSAENKKPYKMAASSHETFPSDIEILSSQEWLNDSIIDFYIDYLENKYKSASVKIVKPTQTQAIKMHGSDLFELISPEIFASNVSHICFVVNDFYPDSGNSSGTHWSLLVLEPSTKTFHYIDSLNNHNLTSTRHIVNNINNILVTDYSLETVKCMQQNNTFDCGLYVLNNIEKLLEHNKKTVTIIDDNVFVTGPTNMGQLRQLILSLYKKSSCNRPSSVVFLGDSHLRNCRPYFESLFHKDKFNLLSIFYPNAKFSQVVSNIKQNCKNLTFSDHVIILAGCNNLSSNTHQERYDIPDEDIKFVATHTNVHIIQVLPRYDNVMLNQYGKTFNETLTKKFQNVNNVSIFSLGYWTRNHFNYYGLHVRQKFKMRLCQKIKNHIEKYIQFQKLNQKNVVPVFNSSIHCNAIVANPLLSVCSELVDGSSGVDVGGPAPVCGTEILVESTQPHRGTFLSPILVTSSPA